MNIIIHMGLPKTGTTAIQLFLEKNSDTLTDFGFFYPQFKGSKSTNNLTSGNGYDLCLKVMAQSINPDVLKKTIVNYINDQCKYAESIGCDNIIISSEAFCDLSENNLRLFLSFLPNKNNYCYKFIIIKREPYTWFFSSWLQNVKRNGGMNWLDKSLCDDIDFALRPLNAENIIRSSEFIDSIHILDYELTKTKLVDNFLKIIGIDVKRLHESGIPIELNSGINRSLTKREFINCFSVNKFSNGNVELSELSEVMSLQLVQVVDDKPQKPFFFLDNKVRDKIYEYCEAKGISHTKISSNFIESKGNYNSFMNVVLGKKPKSTENEYKVEEIHSEDDFFNSLSSDEIYYIESLKVVISYYSNLYKKARELAVHKINLYSNSEYKKLVPDNFNAFIYLIIHEDVLFYHVDPYKHYYEYGATEQRVFAENMMMSPMK